MALDLVDQLRDHAVEMRCDAELEGIRDIVERGTGAQRQLDVWEREGDLEQLMRRIVEASRA
jgi:carboxylate-amine ligase